MQVEGEKFVDDRMMKFYRTTEELTTPEVVTIKGNVPKWFTGTYLRAGPGVFDLKSGFTMKHWFDGYSIMSKFQIADGKVTFEKKYLQSDAFKRATASGKPCICEYATKAYTDPSKGIMTRIFNTISPEFSDNANIALFNLGQTVFITGETSYFHELDVSSLQTPHRYDTNKLYGINSVSAHPVTDETGTTYNIGLTMAPLARYCIVKIPPANGCKDSKEILKKGKILCSLSPRWNRNLLSYVHSFGVTKHYIVFIEQPYCISLAKIIGSVLSKGQSFEDWMEWKPDHKNKFRIIDKETGKVASNVEFYSDEPFFFAHFINCFEENGQVVLNLSAYSDPDVLDTQYMDRLRNGQGDSEETRAAGRRYVVPIDVDMKNAPENKNLVKIPNSRAKAYRRGNLIVCHPDILCDRGLEFPGINRKFIGRKHRFYYASGLTSKGKFQNSMVKVNMETQEVLIWKDDDNYVLGEPMFVPSPDMDYSDLENEDEGVLICPMTDFRVDKSDMLLFLDPKSMKELGRAAFKTQVPPAVHGHFVPS